MITHELSENGDYGAFEAMVMAELNEHAPVKQNMFVQTMALS